jgi:hypothetical protein
MFAFPLLQISYWQINMSAQILSFQRTEKLASDQNAISKSIILPYISYMSTIYLPTILLTTVSSISHTTAH